MKITILDAKTMGQDISFDILKEYGELKVFQSTSSCETVDNIGDSDIIILNKVKISKDVMDKCVNLKLICVFATGYDNIDIEAAKKHNIGVCNVPSYSTDSVTIITFATALSLLTHLSEYSKYVKSGQYTRSNSPNQISPVFHELKGLTWGIVGYGNIGKSVANIASAFGAKVIVCRKNKTDNSVDLEYLCKTADIISLHCPLNEETRCMINKTIISTMKSSVILINEARGAVVNEEDVTEAVLAGKIAAYGCDVYSEEPLKHDHPYTKLYGMDNVILTPHAAWGAYESRVRCLNTVYDNIKSFINLDFMNRVDI